jgi:ribosomal protein S18 acetylase RimI-like enzyme
MSPMAYSAKPSVLRCSRCGRFVDWAEARLQIVCGCRPHLDLPPVLTRPATSAERVVALELFRRDFGRTRIATFGEVVSLEDTSTIVADMQGDISGALAWKARDDGLQIVALATDPMWQRSGVGGHLVAEAEALARRNGTGRMVLATTNDNLPALYFYQRRGYRIFEVVRNAWREHADLAFNAGFADIPVLDELRLEKMFDSSGRA